MSGERWTTASSVNGEITSPRPSNHLSVLHLSRPDKWRKAGTDAGNNINNNNNKKEFHPPDIPQDGGGGGEGGGEGGGRGETFRGR